MEKKTIKILFAVIMCLTLIFSMVACGSKPAENSGGNSGGSENNSGESAETTAELPDVVTIGVQTLITPELIARQEAIYEEYLGTKVELVQCDSGADVNRAFASGSLDIASLGTSPAAIGISGDIGYEVIWYLDVIGAAESLAATEASGIKSVEDLVGKTVATPFASTAHYSLLNALSLAGVNPADVNLLDMQPDDIYAAWKRGDLDAAYVWNPVLGELAKDGGVMITDSAKLAEQGVVTADLSVADKEFAEKYPNVVAGFIKAQLYALDVFYGDEAKAVSEIAACADISEEDAKEQIAGFIYPKGEEQITAEYLGTKGNPGAIAETLKSAADFLVEQGSIDSAPDLSVFQENVTGEFVEMALEG